MSKGIRCLRSRYRINWTEESLFHLSQSITDGSHKTTPVSVWITIGSRIISTDPAHLNQNQTLIASSSSSSSSSSIRDIFSGVSRPVSPSSSSSSSLSPSCTPGLALSPSGPLRRLRFPSWYFRCGITASKASDQELRVINSTRIENTYHQPSRRYKQG